MVFRGSGAVIFGAGLLAAWVFAACGSVSNKSDAGAGGAIDAPVDSSGSDAPVDSSGSDAPVDSSGSDAPAVACDLSKPFGTPALVASLDIGGQEVEVWLTDDSSTALVALSITGFGCCGIASASRTATGDFGPLAPLANIDRGRRPVLSSDRMTLFVASNRAIGDAGGSSHILVATRNDALADFGMPGLLPGENAGTEESPGSLSADGHLLYLDGVVGADRDIYVRDLTTSGPPTPVAELNTGADEASAVISNDGRTIYFATTRSLPGSAADAAVKTDFDVWVAHRDAATGTFSNLAPVTELNSGFSELPNWVSPDGCTIYLSSARLSGTRAIWVASKPAN